MAISCAPRHSRCRTALQQCIDTEGNITRAKSTTTSDGHVDDERDADEALPDSYWAGGLVRLGLPGLVDEAAPLGSQKVSRGVGKAVGHHVVGEVGVPLGGDLVV